MSSSLLHLGRACTYKQTQSPHGHEYFQSCDRKKWVCITADHNFLIKVLSFSDYTKKGKLTYEQ